MAEIEWILDGHAGTVPHLLELAEGTLLPDADDQTLVVEVVCVVAEEAQPQVEGGGTVGAQSWPHAGQGPGVGEVPRVPPVNLVHPG